MTSDEIKAEAERRFPLWLPTGDYEIDREDYSELDAKWQNEDTERDRAHFVQGAEWQAEQAHRDESEIAKVAAQRAVRIHELEVELRTVELDKRGDLELVRYYKRSSDSSDTLRKKQADLTAEHASRADRAEAKLDKVRAYVDEGLDGMPPDPYDEAQGTLRVIRRILDGES